MRVAHLRLAAAHLGRRRGLAEAGGEAAVGLGAGGPAHLGEAELGAAAHVRVHARQAGEVIERSTAWGCARP